MSQFPKTNLDLEQQMQKKKGAVRKNQRQREWNFNREPIGNILFRINNFHCSWSIVYFICAPQKKQQKGKHQSNEIFFQRSSSIATF